MFSMEQPETTEKKVYKVSEGAKISHSDVVVPKG